MSSLIPDADDLFYSIYNFINDPTQPQASADRAIKIGTVDGSYAGTGAAKVTFDGETVMGTRTYPIMEPVLPGDRVALLPIGRSYVILGKIGGRTERLGDLVPIALTTTDLNTLTTQGLYYTQSSTDSTLLRNYPVARAGQLEVLAGGTFVLQRYYTRQGVEVDANRVYVRTNNSGTWSAWREQAQAGFFGVPLAQAIDRVAVGALASLASVDVNIVFPSGRFTQPPMVMVTAYGSRTNWQVTDGTVTTSGCTVRGSNWTSGSQAATYVGYHAVQMTAASGAG